MNADDEKRKASWEKLKKELPPEVYEILRAVNSIAEGNIENCPTCGQDPEPLQQIGRSVYGACGHRLYQGILPANRRNKK